LPHKKVGAITVAIGIAVAVHAEITFLFSEVVRVDIAVQIKVGCECFDDRQDNPTRIIADIECESAKLRQIFRIELASNAARRRTNLKNVAHQGLVPTCQRVVERATQACLPGHRNPIEVSKTSAPAR
jgi:hypothetical protein